MLSFYKSQKTAIHLKYQIIFWCIYFCLNFLRWGFYFDDFHYSLKSNLVEFPLHIIFFYLHTNVFIPKLILKKKIFYYCLCLLAGLIMIYVVRTKINYLFVTEVLWPESHIDAMFFNINHFIAVSLGELYALTFVLAIKLVFDLKQERVRNTKLLKLQGKTELQFLKAQLEPHFFFNTLNNLYALVLKKDTSAPELLLKLSNFMRYVIYETYDTKVLIRDEIAHIKNYVELKKIVFYDRLEFKIQIDKKIKNETVPPLLLMTFVENCFKHGIENNRICVSINIKKKGNAYCEFSITNKFDPVVTNSYASGIGIKNVKRRLKLLYEDDFNFDIHKTKDQFTINLTLPQ